MSTNEQRPKAPMTTDLVEDLLQGTLLAIHIH